MNDCTIRPVRPDDESAAYHVCLKTGDNGRDGESFYRDDPDALAVPRFEGIYELVTEHLWSPAFTAVFNTNNKSGVTQ